MHSTQHYILSVLKQHSPRRYRDLIPADMEGNTFTHHLRAVIEAGLVERQGEEYGLTLSGLTLIDRWSISDYLPRLQPKIMVEVVYQNEDGEYLLVEQLFEPHRGKIGFPCGRLHLGERLGEAAARELQEKAGLMAQQFIPYGCLAMETQRDGNIFNHLITHVFKAENVSGELQNTSPLSRSFFAKLSAVDENLLFPGFQAVVQRTQGAQLVEQFYFDEVF